ncbi:MAG: GNAT family N-acetyltransferase [Actinobacteria bacterium]|nr:GNAT family N-acetyltransferase [Actinomycetota bacterium]
MTGPFLATSTRLVVGPDPPEGWDELAEASTDLIFATSSWAGVVRAAFRTEVLFAALVEGEGRPVLGLIGSERRVPGFRMFHSLVPYGGLIGDRSRSPELFELLLPELRRRGYHSFAAEDTDTEAPTGARLTVVHGIRHVLDLSEVRSEEDLVAGYPKALVRGLRKAERVGLEVSASRDPADVDAIYDLYLAAMERNRAPAWYPRGLYREIHRRLVPDRADYLVASLDGRPVAMVAMVRSGLGTHYWMGGSVPEAFPARANDTLFHRAILGAVARGDRYFDFMGTRADDLDLRRFKEKWGARPVPVLGYQASLSAFRGRLWRAAYRVARSGPGAWLTRRLQRSA